MQDRVTRCRRGRFRVRPPSGQCSRARQEKLEVTEQRVDPVAAAREERVRALGVELVEDVHVFRGHAGRDVGDHHVAVGGQCLLIRVHQGQRVVLVGDVVQYRREQQGDRSVQVELFRGSAQHGVRLPQVGQHDLGAWLLGQQPAAVHHRQRFVVHVEHSEVVGSALGDVVDVADGRSPGPDVEELPDTSTDQVLDRTSQERPVLPVAFGDSGKRFLGPLDETSLDAEVVVTTEERVVDTSGAR